MEHSADPMQSMSARDRKRIDHLKRAAERERRKQSEREKSAAQRFESRIREILEVIRQSSSALDAAKSHGKPLARVVEMKTVQFEQACQECNAVLDTHRDNWNIWGPSLIDILELKGAVTIQRAQAVITRAQKIYSEYKRQEDRELKSGKVVPLVTSDKRRSAAANLADRKRKLAQGLVEVTHERIVTIIDPDQHHRSRYFILKPGTRATPEQASAALPAGVTVV
jgi:hypothetical protein